MEIKRSNWFARYYNWIYRGYANDLCSFFWGTLFAALLFPLVVPGRLITISGDNLIGHVFRGFFFWLIYLTTIFVGFKIIDSFGYRPDGILGWLVLAPVVGAACFALFFVTIAGFIEGIEFVKDRDISSIESAKNWVGAIRGKYCTKINWK